MGWGGGVEGVGVGGASNGIAVSILMDSISHFPCDCYDPVVWTSGRGGGPVQELAGGACLP